MGHRLSAFILMAVATIILMEGCTVHNEAKKVTLFPDDAIL